MFNRSAIQPPRRSVEMKDGKERTEEIRFELLGSASAAASSNEK
jgi:hypothetical protein